MAPTTRPTIDDLMPEVVEFAVHANDLIQICTGAKWKPDLSRGRQSPDMDLSCDKKGVVVKTDDLEQTVPWKALTDWVLARRDTGLLAEVRAAYRTYCDVCMESQTSWENWQTDPDHKQLLDEHQARYSAAVDALAEAVRAITRRDLPADDPAPQAEAAPAADGPPPLPVKSGPCNVPTVGLVTVTPTAWKVLWAAQQAGGAGIETKGIPAPTRLRLTSDDLIAETGGRLHLTPRGVVVVDWLNRDHSIEPMFRLVGRYQPGDGTHDGDQVERTLPRKQILRQLNECPGGPAGFWEGLFETADELTPSPGTGYAYRIDWEHPETTGQLPDTVSAGAPEPAAPAPTTAKIADPGDEPVAPETPAQLMAALGLTSWVPNYPWPVAVTVWQDAPVEVTEDMARALEAMHRAGSTDWYALDVTDDTGGRLVSGGLARESMVTPGLVMLTPPGREVARWLDPDWPDAAVTVDGPAAPAHTGTDAAPVSGELVELEHCTRARAEELTEAIRGQLGDLWDLVKAAYAERAWVPLGHDSWDAYCAAEFAGKQIRLPREERPETVRSLRDAGMSVRAIASATGLGRGTVARALDDTSGVPNGTPEPDDQALDLGAGHAPPAKVTGADGKRYDRARPTAPASTAEARPDAPATAADPETDPAAATPGWDEPELFTPPAPVPDPEPADDADGLVAECAAAITQFRAAVELLETLTVELDADTTPQVLELWRGHLIYADGALGDVRYLIGLPRPGRAGAA